MQPSLTGSVNTPSSQGLTARSIEISTLSKTVLKLDSLSVHPPGEIAVLNNQTIAQIENQNFVVIGAGTPLWEK